MLDHTLSLSLDDDRHLIVGDIHGRYDCFLRLLDNANYDPTKDIIYCVGDLIDRGKDSWEVVEFFQRERCYTIRGNHEIMATDKEWRDTWLRNGGPETIASLKRNNRTEEDLKHAIRQMPWVIEVGEDDEEDSFRLLHAEFPPDWSDADLRKVLGEAMNADDPRFAKLMWSRSVIEHAFRNIRNNRPLLDSIFFNPDRKRRTFVGHTSIPSVLQVGDMWYVDTYWPNGTLSLVDARTLQLYTASEPVVFYP